MINNIEMFLVISNSAILFAIGYIFGSQNTSNDPKKRIHPDFLDEYNNFIIDNEEEPEYNGVILYEDDGDDDDTNKTFYQN